MDWIETEYGTLNMGDKRLNKRGKRLLKRFSDKPMESIPESCKGWSETKAAYRFFENESVTARRVIKPHRLATLDRIRRERVVLLIEDTTTLNYSGQKEREDLGPIQQENVRGIFLHPMLAITPDRQCLGVVSYEQWSRQVWTGKTAEERRAERCCKRIKEKESYRWVRGYKKARKLAKAIPATQFIYMADREGDIYDIYHEAKKGFSDSTADWIIRATYDRAILDEVDPQKRKRLKGSVREEGSIGEIRFAMPALGNRKKREVVQKIFTKEVTLLAPREKAKEGLTPVKVTVVMATEVNPSAGEKAIEWVLLTSMEIPDLKAAVQVIQYYLSRWQIEIYFKILKSGCAIEKRQLSDKQRFDPCLAMYLIVAWRLLFLTMSGRAHPSLNSECVFDQIEWQTAYIIIYKKPPPKNSPPLQEVLNMVAQLGGFLGRKSDGYPGPKVMWKGLRNLYEYIRARDAFECAFGHTYG